MSLKTAKTWSLRVVTVLLLIISFYISHVFLESYSGTSRAPAPTQNKTSCDSVVMSKKWEGLGFNMTRNRQLFLRLADYLWKAYPSSIPLPYGIKGTDAYLLKVLAITASYDLPGDIKSLPCKTCVVIGNGFSIKSSSLGDAINKYDVVIRLNDAPVRGYENDVGSKTTMRFFYPESAIQNPDSPDTIMVLVPFKPQDLRWIKEILYNERRVRSGFWRPPPLFWLGKPSQIRILDPSFMRLTASRLLNIPITNNPHVHPTTGILAVFVALNFCDVVHIAGFGYPDSGNLKQPVHYFGNGTMKIMKNSHHDVRREADALKWLRDSGAILFLKPSS